MDLWIRSQDKKRLVHAYGCEIVEALDGWKIREYATNDFVGKYKTEQRAIEVLDAIQSLLNDKFVIDKPLPNLTNSVFDDGRFISVNSDAKVEILPRTNVIYQMPADDEVAPPIPDKKF